MQKNFPENFEKNTQGAKTMKQEQYTLSWIGKENSKMLAEAKVKGKTLIFFPEETKNAKNSENIYIEGDNLEALKLMKESDEKNIDVIYIDPPYNTGKEFVYNDKFKAECRHSKWLSMMYPRLKVSRDLLAENGIIFISINDNEQANLKILCDEIYGEENFIATLIWEKTQHFGRQKLNCYSNAEYILCYAKNLFDKSGLREILVEKIQEEFEDAPLYNASNNENVLVFPPGTVKFKIPDGMYKVSRDNKYKLMKPIRVINGHNEDELILKFRSRWTQAKIDEEIDLGTTYLIKTTNFAIRTIYRENKKSNASPRQIIFTNSKNPLVVNSRFGLKVGTSESGSKEIKDLLNEGVFTYPKPVSLIAYLISLYYSDGKHPKDFTVLDFFAGSSTTAEAVMSLNAADGGRRKFIMIQSPENTNENSKAYKAGYKNICEIGKERIKRAGNRIQKEYKNSKLDVGFKIFKVL